MHTLLATSSITFQNCGYLVQLAVKLTNLNIQLELSGRPGLMGGMARGYARAGRVANLKFEF